MISNCGHDERGDQYRGGQAGDQTGTEWEIKPWSRYHTGWDVVLRFEDRSVAQMIADIARAAAENNFDWFTIRINAILTGNICRQAIMILHRLPLHVKRIVLLV